MQAGEEALEVSCMHVLCNHAVVHSPELRSSVDFNRLGGI